MKSAKYGLDSLHKQFPTDRACLEFMFDATHERTCDCGGRYSLVKGTRKFQCSRCRFRISPTAHTIFHKTTVPLTLWFHTIMVFSNAKSGISAQVIERDLEVTYKTAWRMLRLIRQGLRQGTALLHGDVEMDTGYFGGKGHAGRDNKYLGQVMRKKAIVFAAVQRGGAARVNIMQDASARSHGDFLKNHISPASTRLLTDGAKHYRKVAAEYQREFVEHTKGEYVRGDVHVNNVENFWSHVKRSIKGTHKSVSKRHLQSYLDGFVFHYNNRHNDKERFALLLGTLLHAAK